MIDIHCHILPGVDDGATDLAEASAMAKAAAADGIAEIVATPHWTERERLAAPEWRSRFAELGSELESLHLPIRIHLGAELPLEPDLPSLAARGTLPTLAGGPYVLVEPPFTMLPGYVEQILFELQALGLRPIVAHPERCATLQMGLRRLFVLVGRGVLVQLNAGSLTGHYGGRAQSVARELLRQGLAHVIASDGHDSTGRPPLLSPALAEAAQIIGEAGTRLLVIDNPTAILAGRLVTAPPTPTTRKPRFGRLSWFQFGGRPRTGQP